MGTGGHREAQEATLATLALDTCHDGEYHKFKPALTFTVGRGVTEDAL